MFTSNSNQTKHRTKYSILCIALLTLLLLGVVFLTACEAALDGGALAGQATRTEQSRCTKDNLGCKRIYTTCLNANNDNCNQYQRAPRGETKPAKAERTARLTACQQGCYDKALSATFIPGSELCDGRDNDYDDQTDEGVASAGSCSTGLVGVCSSGGLSCAAGTWQCTQSVQSSAELCNSLDDDCDGMVDNGFDLQTDVNNCGSCGNVCSAGQVCSSGVCSYPPIELSSCSGAGQQLTQEGRTYLLVSDVTVGEEGSSCFTINDNNIVLDCNDHRITTSTGDYGIYLGGNGVKVMRCRIDGFLVNGVRVIGNNNIVERNIITDIGEAGVSVAGGSDNEVIQNNIAGSDSERGGAVSIVNSIRAVVRGNQIRNNRGTGLTLSNNLVEHTVSHIVSDNVLCGNAKDIYCRNVGGIFGGNNVMDTIESSMCNSGEGDWPSGEDWPQENIHYSRCIEGTHYIRR